MGDAHYETNTDGSMCLCGHESSAVGSPESFGGRGRASVDQTCSDESHVWLIGLGSEEFKARSIPGALSHDPPVHKVSQQNTEL